jgi:hypothetical protein
MVAVQTVVVFAGGESAQRVVNSFGDSVAHEVKRIFDVAAFVVAQTDQGSRMARRLSGLANTKTMALSSGSTPLTSDILSAYTRL